MVYENGLRGSGAAWGPYAVFGYANDFIKDISLYTHELHHIWQSRAMGDVFLFNYALQGLYAGLLKKYYGSFLFNAIYKSNYFETQGYDHHWFE